MRKLFTLFVVAFAALSVSAGELKIGSNDSQTYYAPVYATWADSYYCSQILYSATELSALQGQQITHLAFFLRAINPNGDYSNVEIRFKEVDYTAFSEAAYVSIDDAVLVYDGSLPSGSATELTVELIAPYAYQGGTLLVDVRKTVKGGAYAPSSGSGSKGRFQSTSCTDYTVLYNYDKSALPTSASRTTNRPDIKFTYSEAAAVTCPKVSTLAASAVTANSATLTWDSEAENFQFVCVLKGAEPAWEGVAAKALKTVTLDTLKSNTGYDFYVRSYCSETEQGAEKKVSFQTELSCFAPTMLSVPEEQITAESAVVSWHASGKGEAQYQYTYALYGAEPNWEGAPTTSELTATLTGLNAASMYQVWVRSYCSADDQSDAVTEYFTTECGALSLPYSEDFESTDANELPSCWARVSTDGFPAVFADSYYDSRAYAGSKSLKFYGYEVNQIAVLPELEDALSTAAVTFWYTASDDAESPVPAVGYITDLADATSFVAVKTLAAASEYTQAQVTFDAAPAGARIAIRYQGGTWFGSLFVDNLEIIDASELPTAIDNTAVTNKAAKRLINGQVTIEHNGVRYNVLGAELK